MLWVVVSSGFLEGEVDTAVVGPVEFSGMAEGDVAAGGEDGVKCVKIQVAEEIVVCRGKGLGDDCVGDGVAELWSGPRGSEDKGSSESGVGVDVNMEVKVFGGIDGVIGVG
ncbi:hypothetical protein NDU88_003863 [Pleurodeles waltl]|uniref:Uncharacterized protein n=1 Tax=Pleurodeles waltl TaxID=8319 RepID=A0AAV7WQB1_PLEWA|nr:hypothetical protein NDU88_003863 [Pleurodeles waltl]